jgi:hypothetical protein
MRASRCRIPGDGLVVDLALDALVFGNVVRFLKISESFLAGDVSGPTFDTSRVIVISGLRSL